MDALWNWSRAREAEARAAIARQPCACGAAQGVPCVGTEAGWRGTHVSRLYGVRETMTLREYDGWQSHTYLILEAVAQVPCPRCHAPAGTACPSVDPTAPSLDTHAVRMERYHEARV